MGTAAAGRWRDGYRPSAAIAHGGFGSPKLALEPLEPRLLLSAVPTNLDQYLLELINRARSDPAAEAAMFGIDLNLGLAPGTITSDPKQPLAFNAALIDAAQTHTQWMLDTDTVSHIGAGGSTPGERMTAAGYLWTVEGEAIVAGWPVTPGGAVAFTAAAHEALFVDDGGSGPVPRVNILGAGFREMGVGVLVGMYSPDGWDFYDALMVTEDFGAQAGNSFLTGVAYDDIVIDDDFYGPYEGLGSVTVEAVRDSDSATFSVQTWSTGGYSLQLPAGTYTVTASRAGHSDIVYTGIMVGTQNVKADFTWIAAPTAPVFLSPPAVLGGIEGQSFAHDFDTDVEGGGGVVTYSIQSGPAWLTVQNATRGIVGGLPEDLAQESFDVTIRAENDYGGHTDHTFILNIPNVGPTIALDEPAGGGTVGAVYTISWTDSDVGDNASIDLFWDIDANPTNNDAGNEGTTWGRIATSLSENALDTYDWTVDTPFGVSSCYLSATIDDGTDTDTDYTAGTLAIDHPVVADYYVGTIVGPGGAAVHVYDVSGPVDVTMANVVVKWGKDGSIGGIQLVGYDAMGGLGLAITGTSYFGGLRDGRKGAKGDMAFIVCHAPMKSIQLKGTGIIGYRLNGDAPGGIALPADIDGDGDTGDATAIYCTGYVDKLQFDGNTQGDIWIGGTDPEKGTALKSFGNKTGGYHGDFFGNGNVDKFELGGDLASSIYVAGSLKSLTVKGGNLAGDVTVEGGLGKLDVKGGKNGAGGGTITAAAQITVSGFDPKKGLSVESLSITGNFLGNLTTAGGVGKVGSKAGEFTGTMDIGGDLASMSLGGDFHGDATVAGNAGKLAVNGGNFGSSLTVLGNLDALDIKGGKTGGGMMMAGAMIQVGGFLGKATVAAYQTDNGGAEFGIYVGSTAGVTVGTVQLTSLELPFSDGDFRVRIV